MDFGIWRADRAAATPAWTAMCRTHPHFRNYNPCSRRVTACTRTNTIPNPIPMDPIDPQQSETPTETRGEWRRRDALKLAGATLGAAAFAKAIAPIAHWAADQSVDDFLQRHYKQ